MGSLMGGEPVSDTPPFIYCAVTICRVVTFFPGAFTACCPSCGGEGVEQ